MITPIGRKYQSLLVTCSLSLVQESRNWYVLSVIWSFAFHSEQGLMFLHIDQGQHHEQYKCFYPCPGYCPWHALSYNSSTLQSCCTHGMFHLVLNPQDYYTYWIIPESSSHGMQWQWKILELDWYMPWVHLFKGRVFNLKDIKVCPSHIISNPYLWYAYVCAEHLMKFSRLIMPNSVLERSM